MGDEAEGDAEELKIICKKGKFKSLELTFFIYTQYKDIS